MPSNVSLIRRFASMLYDGLLLFSLLFFVFGVVVILFANQAQLSVVWFYTITLPCSYLYFSLSWLNGGQTLGMRAWKLKIVQKNGDNITPKQAFIRLILATVSLGFFGLGFFYQWFNQRHLTLHDKYSKTRLQKI